MLENDMSGFASGCRAYLESLKSGFSVAEPDNHAKHAVAVVFFFTP